MNGPETYGEWVLLLEKLKNGTDDADILRAMKRGTLAWQDGIAERFMKRLMETVVGRMDRTADQFKKEMGRAHGESDIIRALLAMRKHLVYLLEVVDLPAIPEEIRKPGIQLIIDQSEKIQHSLESSARKDRSGKMESLIRRHSVAINRKDTKNE